MKTWPNNLLSFLEIETKAENKDDLNAGIVLAFSNLEKQDERILLLYFTCGYTVDEIATRVNVCKATVSRSLNRCKVILRSASVRPLLEYGRTFGIAKIRQMYLVQEKNYKIVPVTKAFPEPNISKSLQKAGLLNLGDVERVQPIIEQKVKGIGKKYNDTISLRLFNYKSVSMSRNARKEPISVATEKEFKIAVRSVAPILEEATV